MFRKLCSGLVAFFLFGSNTANAEIQCGFGCFLIKNKNTIDNGLKYSADIAREYPTPPTQLYGWGIYALYNLEDIYKRSKKNKVSLWVSSKAQVVKETPGLIIGVIAPKWGKTVVERMKKSAVNLSFDYSWGELFEAGYSNFPSTDQRNDSPKKIEPEEPVHLDSWIVVSSVVKQSNRMKYSLLTGQERCKPFGYKDAYDAVAESRNPDFYNQECGPPVFMNDSKDYVSYRRQCVSAGMNREYFHGTKAIDKDTYYIIQVDITGQQRSDTETVVKRCR